MFPAATVSKLAEVVTAWACLWEVTTLNFSCDTNYIDWDYLWFFPVPPGTCWVSAWN